MKRKFIYFLLVFIVYSCQREIETVDLAFDKKEGITTFYPKNISTFFALSDTLDSIACNQGIRPYLNLSLRKNEFLFEEIYSDKLIIQSGNGCPWAISCKINPSMVITNDYEKMIYDWRDEDFQSKMEEYIFNPNDRPDLAPKPSKAYFRFNLIPETSLEETAEIITKTALNFQKIQQKYPEVKIFFVPILKFWNPPPPPPKQHLEF